MPLKLGRIRASYPDVRPISLSRKSEGDIADEGSRPDILSYSCPAVILRHGAASESIIIHCCSAANTERTFSQPGLLADVTKTSPFVHQHVCLANEHH